MVTIAITIATMGRRMKKRDTGLLSSLGRRSVRMGGHDRAVLDGGAVDDDLLTGFQPGLDHPARADTRTERDIAHGDLVALAHDLQLVPVLELRDRPLRNEQRVGPDRRLRPDACALTGTKHVARIWKEHTQANRAHLGIDFAIDG